MSRLLLRGTIWPWIWTLKDAGQWRPKASFLHFCDPNDRQVDLYSLCQSPLFHPLLHLRRKIHSACHKKSIAYGAIQ
jgi:hypothetical protein